MPERREGESKLRGRHRKEEDAGLLLLIRALVNERLSYGYRRNCALANRKLRDEGKPPTNMKRELRIMHNNTLTLERHAARIAWYPVTNGSISAEMVRDLMVVVERRLAALKVPIVSNATFKARNVN